MGVGQEQDDGERKEVNGEKRVRKRVCRGGRNAARQGESRKQGE